MTMIKSVNLSKTFMKDSSCTYAVYDCNVEINEGEFVVISGVKESGKTTLLHLLGGYERPSDGTVFINNNDVSLFNDDELANIRRKEVGYLHRNDSLIPELTVHENIIMPLLLDDGSYDEEYFNELTDSLHLTGILKRYPKHLNTIQLRYVTLARALINRPSILLMDEPIFDFYPQIDKDVLDYLLNIVRIDNKTFIMVTNRQEYSIYANHIIKLRSGVVVEDKFV